MYVHLAQTSGEENFVFSPLSLHSALTLLYLGTKDNSVTQQQLGAAMGIVNNPLLLKLSYQKVIETYKDQDSFLYGNHIWVGNDVEIKSVYKYLVRRQSGSVVSNLDFQQQEAVETVNGWISNMTRGKIENLVDSFSAETQMFLANALYFNEKWLEPFEETDYAGNIIEEYFNTNAGMVKVPMIQQTSSKMIYGEIQTENGILEVVTIPYKNDNFKMQIINPKYNKGLNILEDQMKLRGAQDDKSSFKIFLKFLKNESVAYIEDVNLRMPKFKLKSKFDAAEALQSLGEKDIFTSGAEFDKIIGGGSVGVGKVIHEAVLEVTRKGTDEATATGVEIVLFSASFGEEKNILLDRLFIFIVQDRLNNIPVLVGRVKNPSYP